MPLMRITARKGALSLHQKTALADALTDIILLGEVGHASPPNRKFAHVLFDEFDAGTQWFTNGRAAADEAPGLGLLIFEVFYPEAAADQPTLSWLHAQINAVAARILLGPDAPLNGLANWVQVHALPEGSWGVRGRTIGIQAIANGPAVPLERIAYADAWLAANARARKAHGYPAAIETAEAVA